MVAWLFTVVQCGASIVEPLLGVAIGLVRTFAVVAVIVSSVTELVSGA